MIKPNSKYDRILGKFRENDFKEAEVKEIKHFLEEEIKQLPRMAKLTIAEYQALEEKKNNTIYLITNNAGTKIISTFVGTLPVVFNAEGIYDESCFANAVFQ